MTAKIFERIYEENKLYVYNFALRLTGFDEYRAEELTQDAFYNAFVSFSRFRGECDIKTWLCSITKNIFFRQLRNEKKNSVSLDEIEYKRLSECCDTPEKIFESRDIHNAILREIKSLKPKFRDVIVLRLFSELSYAQIASALKISEGSAKVIYHRARMILQERLKEVYRNEK